MNFIQAIPLYTREDDQVFRYFQDYRPEIHSLTGTAITIAIAETVLAGDAQDVFDTLADPRYRGLRAGDLPCLWIEDADTCFPFRLANTKDAIKAQLRAVADAARDTSSAADLRRRLAGLMDPDPPSSSEVTVLFLAAAPSDYVDVATGREYGSIVDRLRGTEFGRRWRLHPRFDARWELLPGLLMALNPQIVHFSGHARARGLILQNTRGRGRLANGKDIGTLFRLLGGSVRCVVLNACFTHKQGAGIAEYVGAVVGMSRDVDDREAVAYAQLFYEVLGNGKSLAVAFEAGRLAMDSQGDIPVLLPGKGSAPDRIVFATGKDQPVS